MITKAKKKKMFPEIGRVKIVLSLTRPISQMCMIIYIFFVSKKQTHKQKNFQ